MTEQTITHPVPRPQATTNAGQARRLVGRIAAQLALIVVALVAIIPFLFMLRVSLAAPTDYLAGLEVWTAPITLDHYRQVYNNTDLNLFLFNSLVLSVLTTLVVLLIGSMAGFALAKMHTRAKARDNVMFFVLSTRMGPSVVFALPLYLLMISAKLIDTYIGMLLVYTFANLAFAIWLMYSFFRDVPGEVEEAALLDGLSPIGTFRRISLPLVVPGLIATGIFIFIFTWNEFFYALVLTRESAKTFPTMVPAFFGAFRVEWGQMFAASTLGVLPPIIFGLLIRRYLIRGLTFGEVK